MSDREVRAAIEQMEAWLGDPSWEPDPLQLEDWNLYFQGAMARAEKAAGWHDLMTRAHILGPRLEALTAGFIRQRDALKIELELQGNGARALKGYGAGLR